MKTTGTDNAAVKDFPADTWLSIPPVPSLEKTKTMFSSISISLSLVYLPSQLHEKPSSNKRLVSLLYARTKILHRISGKMNKNLFKVPKKSLSDSYQIFKILAAINSDSILFSGEEMKPVLLLNFI